MKLRRKSILQVKTCSERSGGREAGALAELAGGLWGNRPAAARAPSSRASARGTQAACSAGLPLGSTCPLPLRVSEKLKVTKIAVRFGSFLIKIAFPLFQRTVFPSGLYITTFYI